MSKQTELVELSRYSNCAMVWTTRLRKPPGKVLIARKVIWKPTRCNNNSFIDLQWSAQHVSGKILPMFRSARLRFFTTCGIVSCCCGRQGFGARQRGTTCTVWSKLLDCLFPSRCVVSICYNKSPSINTTISWDSYIIQYIWLHVSAYLKPSSGQ